MTKTPEKQIAEDIKIMWLSIQIDVEQKKIVLYIYREPPRSVLMRTKKTVLYILYIENWWAICSS
jgi:hypothetical protein